MFTFRDWAEKEYGDPDYFGKEYKGDITCSFAGLDSLEGAPKIVAGDFDCMGNDLIDLKGAPRTVVGAFKCSNNDNLETLEGAPKTVLTFVASDCQNLTSLKGCPEDTLTLVFSNCPIESLEGCGKTDKLLVNGTKIKNLIGVKTAKEISVANSEIETLEGCPRTLDYLIASNSTLKTLKGGPATVKRIMDVSETQLENFEGGPTKVKALYANKMSKLKTLKGFPKEIESAEIIIKEPSLEILLIDAVLNKYIKKLDVLDGIKPVIAKNNVYDKLKEVINTKDTEKREEICIGLAEEFGYQLVTDALKDILMVDGPYIKIQE